MGAAATEIVFRVLHRHSGSSSTASVCSRCVRRYTDDDSDAEKEGARAPRYGT